MFPLKIIDKKVYILIRADIKKKYLKLIFKILSSENAKKEEKILVDLYIENLTNDFHQKYAQQLKKVKRPIEVTNMFNQFVKQKSEEDLSDTDKVLITDLSKIK